MISIFAVANFVKGEECGDHCCFVHPRKRTAKNLWLHYEGNDMLSNDKLFRFYNSPFSIYNDKVFSSVPFWLQRRSSNFLSVYSMEFFNFKHGQENTFTLPPFRSWKMDVTIIQDSKNFNTHHNFSFSCQEVRFLLIILLALFIFLSDV